MPRAPLNLFADLPVGATAESFQVLYETSAVRIERIASFGHASPAGFWYDQDRPEWVVLMRGGATIAFDDGTRRTLAAGDWLLIPAHCRHRVEHTSDDALWLAVHVGIDGPSATDVV